MKYFLFFSLFLLFTISRCDLPVKCLPHQVEGEWKFEHTQPQAKIPFAQFNCGHQYPDDESTSASVMQKEFKPYKEFKVSLSKDGCLDCENKSDNEKKAWTNVYNEGFDFSMGSKNIFTFFYYQKNSGSYESVCSKTAVGWYIDEAKKEYACIRGQKVSGSEEVNKMENKKRVVVEGVIKEVSLDEKSSQTKILKNLKNYKNTKRFFRFKSSEKSKMRLHENFSDFDAYVELLNSNPNSLWKAKNYDHYKGMKLKDLNKYTGRLKGRDLSVQYPKHQTEKKMRFKNVDHKLAFKGEPNEFFSWENCLTPAKSQGGCGSCFAISSLSMIEARLRLKDKNCEALLKEPSKEERVSIKEKKNSNRKTAMVSLDHTLDCNFYNQGCEGGYPFLVGKFAHDNYLMLKDDYKPGSHYGNHADACKKSPDNKKLVKAQAYGYVGGRYGAADEEQIKEEIRKNGPIVLSYEPGFSMAFYEDGIYNNIDTWVTKKATKPEWTQVDHSVLAFGYGSDSNGNKYWLLQNSWGEGFGQEGNFKIARGVDEEGIESMVEYADPVIQKNN